MFATVPPKLGSPLRACIKRAIVEYLKATWISLTWGLGRGRREGEGGGGPCLHHSESWGCSFIVHIFRWFDKNSIYFSLSKSLLSTFLWTLATATNPQGEGAGELPHDKVRDAHGNLWQYSGGKVWTSQEVSWICGYRRHLAEHARMNLAFSAARTEASIRFWMDRDFLSRKSNLIPFPLQGIGHSPMMFQDQHLLLNSREIKILCRQINIFNQSSVTLLCSTVDHTLASHLYPQLSNSLA